jgi:hypothetical protein
VTAGEPTPPIRFTVQQRKELKGLGVPIEAIDAIELEALPWSQAVFLRQEPRRAEVLAELQAVRAALIVARDAVERLLDAPPSVPHLKAARSKIVGGGLRHAQDGIALDHTSAGLAESIGVIDRAIASVPPGPTRHRSASTMAIERIHDALQQASIFMGSDPHPPGLEPSTSPTSAFRNMIGICYAAMGVPNPDPERALKAYLKQWRALTSDT